MLADGLRRAGVDVVLLALGSPSKSQSRAAFEAGARLVTRAFKLEWMTDADEDVRRTREVVASIAREVGADLVHANQFAAACADVGVPVVLTLHSDVLSWRRWTLGARDTAIPAEWESYVALVQEAVSRADRVVAVSRFLRDQMAELYQLGREIDVVHNGWPAPLDHRAHPRNGTLVAGRIWDAAKNIPLVAAAAVGWNPGPVYLAGETTHPDGGRAPVPLPLQALGFLSRSVLDEQFRRSRLYVSAARYDPFGLLALQAALHGCMLLLSDIPSYREVWGDTATYFAVDDIDDLRAKWRCLLTSEPDSRASVHARRHFSMDRMVSDYERLYALADRAVSV
jgi:glycosyltransferase involved in cell wall biosynthesis